MIQNIKLQQDYENITPWNGANDNGRDVRLKLDRNYERIKGNFSEIIQCIDGLDNFFIRKDTDDNVKGSLTFEKLQKFVFGLISDNFSSGALGSGMCLKKDENGDWCLEVDRALFRKSATFVELIIQSLKHVGGQILLSPASMKCIKVEETDDSYKCFFKNDGSLQNEFEVDDLARCQSFNLKDNADGTTNNAYYWRAVVAVGDDYIELSKTDCDANSTIPCEGDDIVQLGNKTDVTRQNALILSAHGADSPSIKMYNGINSYSLENKCPISMSPNGFKVAANFIQLGTGQTLEKYIDEAIPEDLVNSQELLETGLDIKNKKIILTADDTTVQTNTGKKIAAFTTDSNGNPVLNAECIEFEKLHNKNNSFYSDANGNVVMNNATLQGGTFNGYIKTTYINVDESDALLVNGSYNLVTNLNIRTDINSGVTNIVLPTHISYAGAKVSLFNGCFPPYSRTVGSYRESVIKVNGSNAILGIETGLSNSTSKQLYTQAKTYGIRWVGGCLDFVAVPNTTYNRVDWVLISNTALSYSLLDSGGTYNELGVHSTNGVDWYHKYNNGWLECGGLVTGTWGRAEVIFPSQFKTKPLSITATVNTSEYMGYGIGYYEECATGVKLVSNKNYDKITFSWEAKGFWK